MKCQKGRDQGGLIMHLVVGCVCVSKYARGDKRREA
jgi:hypothetical protein